MSVYGDVPLYRVLFLKLKFRSGYIISPVILTVFGQGVFSARNSEFVFAQGMFSVQNSEFVFAQGMNFGLIKVSLRSRVKMCERHPSGRS